MSVCRHLPGGVTEFEWQIDDYDQRLKTTINGDEWTSEIFTANLPGEPKFSLIFTPLIPFKPHSEDYPYMACPYFYDRAVVRLDNYSAITGIRCSIWMKDDNGNIIWDSLPLGIASYRSYTIKPRLPPTTRRFYICVDIIRRAAVASESNKEEKVVDLLSVDSTAPKYVFVLDISNELGSCQEYEINDKKFTLRHDKNTATLVWDNGASNERSYEFYLCEFWMQNKLGHQSFISRRNAQLFRCQSVGILKDNRFRCFGVQRLSHFCIRVRPYNSCLQNEIRHSHTVNFNSSQFGDVKVVANDGGVFYMPKVVLFSHSDKFKDQVDLDSKTLKTILWLMCTGKVKNKKMANSELHAIAGRYQLDEIQELIVEIMLENLCVESAVDALKLAFEFDHMAEFKEKTIKFVLNNFDEIAKSNEWKQLAVSHVEIVTHLISASYHSSKL
ncbi:hypothetical protein M3Y95_01197100 [Aphelenchoides besseyi]|nr:hypothetical protein M3Y95_01197100 [Aphelenchoides besseyi]